MRKDERPRAGYNTFPHYTEHKIDLWQERPPVAEWEGGARWARK